MDRYKGIDREISFRIDSLAVLTGTSALVLWVSRGRLLQLRGQQSVKIDSIYCVCAGHGSHLEERTRTWIG